MGGELMLQFESKGRLLAEFLLAGGGGAALMAFTRLGKAHPHFSGPLVLLQVC